MTIVVKRAKTGCLTCRIRKIKCDELRPDCHKCVSTGRKCEGYTSLPFSRRDLTAASQSSAPRQTHRPDEAMLGTGLLSRLATDPAFSDVLERRYFQFFRLRTVTSTNSLVDSRFWDRVVLQACHTEPAIKHAILALSSWHQLFDPAADLAALQKHRTYADKQYQLALEHAKVLVSSASPADVDRVLIACVVFICFENVRGNFLASHIHMDSGRAIARQHRGRFRETSRRNDLVEIEQAFGRLDLSAICFSDDSSPYKYTLDDFLATKPKSIPWEFDNVREARTTLVDLLRWFMLIDAGMSKANASDPIDVAETVKWTAEKQLASTRVHLWHDYFENTVKKTDRSHDLETLNLRQWYLTLLVLIDTESSGSELKWDAGEQHFELAIVIGERIVERLAKDEAGSSFSYELGYITTMWFIATRCRNPYLRRRAIRILRVVPRQEGTWASVPAAAIAERWMQVEEEGLHDVKSSTDVPGSNRVQLGAITVRAELGDANLVFEMMPERGYPDNRRAEVVRWM